MNIAPPRTTGGTLDAMTWHWGTPLVLELRFWVARPEYSKGVVRARTPTTFEYSGRATHGTRRRLQAGDHLGSETR
jgi:hypothetical protein